MNFHDDKCISQILLHVMLELSFIFLLLIVDNWEANL